MLRRVWQGPQISVKPHSAALAVFCSRFKDLRRSPARPRHFHLAEVRRKRKKSWLKTPSQSLTIANLVTSSTTSSRVLAEVTQLEPAVLRTRFVSNDSQVKPSAVSSTPL